MGTWFKAADLPVGTRIRYRGVPIVRRNRADLTSTSGAYWRGNDGSAWHDFEIDWLFDDGAEIAHDHGKED